MDGKLLIKVIDSAQASKDLAFDIVREMVQITRRRGNLNEINNQDFQFWCDIAGINKITITDRVERLVDAKRRKS